MHVSPAFYCCFVRINTRLRAGAQALDAAQVTKQIDADLQLLGTAQARPEKPLTLYNAIARAILYNREYKLSVMEAALSQRQYDLAKTNMLPALTLSAGYSSRDKYAASASTTFDGDEPAALGASPSYSVSQDKTRTTGSAALTWNVLDFGLSYVRAGQAADRRMVAIERQRKVVHNIVREVTYAYWRAVAAENLLSDLGPLLRRVEKALADSRNIEARRLSSPIEALIYQKELLEIRRTLHTQQRSLMTARLELAQLMGMLPGQDYRLAPVEYIIPEIAMNMSLMENTALLSRPELMEARYQSRISRSEVRAAMYSMFPSLNLTATANSDDSNYQLYNDYVEMGATLSWNLMSVFNGPANRRVAKAQVGVAEQQRLALAMAVISQVHIANLNFVQSRQEYAVAEEFLGVSQRLTKQTRDAQKVAKFGELEVIRQEASLLLATLRRDIAFAELQNSFSTVYASVGLDIVPEQLTDLSAETLTTAITKSLQTWGLKYKSVMAESGRVLKPIADQNPVLGPQGFTFASDTFDVGLSVRYMLGMQSGAPCPTGCALTKPTDGFSNPARKCRGFEFATGRSGTARQSLGQFYPSHRPSDEGAAGGRPTGPGCFLACSTYRATCSATRNGIRTTTANRRATSGAFCSSQGAYHSRRRAGLCGRNQRPRRYAGFCPQNPAAQSTTLSGYHSGVLD